MGIERVSRREAVLDVLRATTAPLGIGEIAETLGVHANTVRFHLEALLESGRVERTTAASGRPGRPHQLFTVVARMDPGGRRNYRMLSEVLVSAVADGRSPQARATEIGRRWGRQHASTYAATAESSADRLVALLDDVGFAPERTDESQIALHHCPFLDLAERHSDVVCAIHLGLMQGAMQAWGSRDGVEALEPFVQPDLCLTRLTPGGS